MKKNSFCVVLFSIIDICLLIVILVSCGKEKEREKTFDIVHDDRERYEAVTDEDYGDSVVSMEYEDSEKDSDNPAEDENTEDTDNAEDTDNTEDTKDTGNDAVSFEEIGKPSLSDFMWYFDGVHYYGLPENYTPIYDSKLITGDWKGFIFYDPDRKFNSYALEFLNVNIDIEGQNSAVTFDLYQYCPENSEIIDVSGESMSFKGSYEAGAVYATGGGNVHIDTFYTMPDNRQYAVGYIDTVDGTPAFLALVRP